MIRDRITVKTKDGTITGLVVQKQGGSLDIKYPNTREPWFMAEVLDKQGSGTGEAIRVPADQIVYISNDQEPKTKKK